MKLASGNIAFVTQGVTKFGAKGNVYVPKLGGGGGGIPQAMKATNNGIQFDCNTIVGVSVDECEGLKQIYDSTAGPNRSVWYFFTSNFGGVANEPCTWKDHYGTFIFVCGSDGIESMNLSNNNLVGDILGVEKLIHLKSLSLQSNSLTSIVGLNALKKLESIDLGTNQLISIPSFGDLSSLGAITLSSNKITQIQGLDQLSNLQSLSLDGNLIESTNGLQNLKNLTTLTLTNNKISNFVGLSNFTKLISLFIGQNQISILPGLDQLKELQNFSAYNNKLVSLEGIETLPKIKEITVSNNLISQFPDMSNVGTLKILKIDNNKLTNQPIVNTNNVATYRINNNLICGSFPANTSKLKYTPQNANPDCNNPPPPVTHLGCVNNACVPIQGVGTDSCTINPNSCAVTPPVINGTCDPLSATSYPSTATSLAGNLCSAGTPDPSYVSLPQPGGSVTWVCKGSGGGSDSQSCIATVAAIQLNPIDGVCGTAHPKNYPFADTSFGTDTWCQGVQPAISPNFPPAGTSVLWKCPGSNGGAQASCHATHDPAPPPVIKGECGPADNGGMPYASTTNGFAGMLCNKGTSNPTTLNFPNPGNQVSWWCNGTPSNSTNNKQCFATRDPINGACGTAHTKTYPYPTLNFGADSLCSAGTQSPNPVLIPLAGTTRNWVCVGSQGSNKGTTANCRAKQEPAPGFDLESTLTVAHNPQFGKYTITVKNNGGIDSKSFDVRLYVPTNSVLMYYGQGGKVSGTNGRFLTRSVSSLKVGLSKTFTFDMKKVGNGTMTVKVELGNYDGSDSSNNPHDIDSKPYNMDQDMEDDASILVN